MQPLPRPSVSPLYSFCTVTPVRRVASFSEVFAEVWRWLRGKPRKVFPTDRLREARLVDEIAAQLDLDLAGFRLPSSTAPSPTRWGLTKAPCGRVRESAQPAAGKPRETGGMVRESAHPGREG